MKLLKNLNSSSKTVVILFFVISVCSGFAKMWWDKPFAGYYYYLSIITGITFIYIAGKYFPVRKKMFDRFSNLIINLFLLWLIICFVRGLFVADTYWEYKHLFTASIALIVFAGAVNLLSEPLLMQRILSCGLKYVAVIVLFTVPFIVPHGFLGHNIMPVAFLALFLCIIKKVKYRLFIVGLCLVVISDLTSRAQVIMYGCALLLGFLGYLRVLNNRRIAKTTVNGVFCASALFVILGITGVFNVLDMSSYMGDIEVETVQDGYIVNESITQDSRSALYEEVILSAVKNRTIFFGNTPARGNETKLFAAIAEITGKEERMGNEAGILNIFAWTGVVGIVLFFSFFYRSAYLAVCRSKNKYLKIVGIWIAIQWVICFSGNDLGTVEPRLLMLSACIAIGFSPKFRAMTDAEFKQWLNGCV